MASVASLTFPSIKSFNGSVWELFCIFWGTVWERFMNLFEAVSDVVLTFPDLVLSV